MQTELIIVSEYCQKCHIEPSFIEMLEEGGLINVRTEAGFLLLCHTGVSLLSFDFNKRKTGSTSGF